MARLALLVLVLVPATAHSADDWDLSNFPQTMKGAKDRKAALALWEKAKPTAVAVQQGKKVEPAAIRAAVENIEEAAFLLERSLDREWNTDGNLELCTIVKAWFDLRPKLVPAAPADEDAKKEQASQAKRAKKKQLRAARKLVMEYCAAQRHEKQVRRCRKCEGRKDLRSPFGDKRACSVCNRRGTMPNLRGIFEARWIAHSPFYRRDTRMVLDANRAMRMATVDPKRLGPFIRSVSIKAVDDHDTWVRIHTEVKTYEAPGSKKNVRDKRVFTLYRVGHTWWIYHEAFDREFLRVPDLDTKKG